MDKNGTDGRAKLRLNALPKCFGEDIQKECYAMHVYLLQLYAETK